MEILEIENIEELKQWIADNITTPKSPALRGSELSSVLLKTIHFYETLLVHKTNSVNENITGEKTFNDVLKGGSGAIFQGGIGENAFNRPFAQVQVDNSLDTTQHALISIHSEDITGYAETAISHSAKLSNGVRKQTAATGAFFVDQDNTHDNYRTVWVLHLPDAFGDKEPFAAFSNNSVLIGGGNTQDLPFNELPEADSARFLVKQYVYRNVPNTTDCITFVNPHEPAANVGTALSFNGIGEAQMASIRGYWAGDDDENGVLELNVVGGSVARAVAIWDKDGLLRMPSYNTKGLLSVDDEGKVTSFPIETYIDEADGNKKNVLFNGIHNISRLSARASIRGAGTSGLVLDGGKEGGDPCDVYINGYNSGPIYLALGGGKTFLGGDMEFLDSADGLVLKSPDNTKWKLSISNAGVASWTIM